MPQPPNHAKTNPKGHVAIGTNVAIRGATLSGTLAKALRALDSASLRVGRISRFYRTPCMPAGAGPDFVNAVAEIETALPPDEVLARLHAVEASFGRVRSERWGPRCLDMDLLALGDVVLPDVESQTAWRTLPPGAQQRAAPDRLILPHPRLQERGFVLVPLAEIAPDWRHPILRRTARELRDALPAGEKAEIVPISGPWGEVSALVKDFQTQ
ncbi:2-amino-4-hydroxy-6-hydroxymethyldihydropteridinediphosphokinase [Rhodovulum sp. ES.010]|uniref:2-amino-4-hydroxy-6- hydroxymethyldihydropteridine diphosphokinase n=1 Tax=Rhodovulum sp. ES.010 TaxID=1882821 RepID=UPI00092B024D|nr:2-amino-4-hydroxy-6-hydroxymethyldihydropteridine diphosphokinase [Rhodovulum sp. ES.010]SIO52221.1 2-amino-4-hydroxy-6-hydroxymethyldihydropteridinediphosphokinase [Rhodovulum sp. ES.010]